MIFTLTLNPSLDYFIYLKDIKKNTLNIPNKTAIVAGGKGINVSKVLKNLNTTNTAITFTGGFCGEKIITELKELNINHHTISVNENTRINLKLKENDGETEIAGQSPTISKESVNKLCNYIKENLQNGDSLICSGSIPNSIDFNIYKQLALLLEQTAKNINVVLDTRGESLRDNLYNNFLIKPNKKELEDMFNQKFNSIKEIIKSCDYFLKKGIKNIIVSMGGEGSLYINANEVFKAEPMDLKMINTVGAGDSMVAGFMTAAERNYKLDDCYKMAVATASATVSKEGLASEEDVEKNFAKVIIKKL